MTIAACAAVLALEPAAGTSVGRAGCLPAAREELKMTIGAAHLQPIVSLIAGILILIVPQLLNYIVAIFLIVSGILGLGLIH